VVSEKQRKSVAGRRRTMCDAWRIALPCWRIKTRRWSVNWSRWRSCTARRSRRRASALRDLSFVFAGVLLQSIAETPRHILWCYNWRDQFWLPCVTVRVKLEGPLLQLVYHILAWSCLLHCENILQKHILCFGCCGICGMLLIEAFAVSHYKLSTSVYSSLKITCCPGQSFVLLCSRKEYVGFYCVAILKQVVKVLWHSAASPPHTDGSVISSRWHHCALHLVHLNWFLQHTGSAPCRVTLSISTIRHARRPGLAPFYPQNCPFTWGSGTPI